MSSSPLRRAFVIFGLMSAALGDGTATAQDIDYATARLDKKVPAVRAVGTIAIDGDLSEADWARAPMATDFIQNEPREGEPASEETEVRVLYDADNLYFGVFARDAEPQRIITGDLTKDFNRQSGDSFEIVLDTFHDERNGYMFATNAGGAKWDAQMNNEGRELNENWDALWTVRTRTAENGWYAEIAIPFRTLRFEATDPQTWGMNFQRRLRRRNEDSYWSPLPRIYQFSRVSMAGTLEGLQGVRPGSDLRVKPYMLGSTGEAIARNVGNDFEAGLDVKYGVTSGLTWDFTLNTDFSQVEADEQQVNLTRVSLFFPEKREFFLENSGVFQFGVNDRGQGGGGGGGVPGRQGNVQDSILFFSRQIGLSEAGAALPILGGTRLTGRAGNYSVGALNIQQRSTATTEATNFTALRLRRNVLANSDIGVMVLNKESAGPHFNRVVGADGNFRFFENLNLNASLAKTDSPQDVVPGEGKDTIGRIGASFRSDLIDFTTSYLMIGDRANNEMGFLPRTGINKYYGRVGVHFRPQRTSGWMREIAPHVEVQNVTRSDGELDSRYMDYHLPFSFQDGTFVEVGVNPNVEDLVTPFAINARRGIVVAPGRYEFNEWFAVWRTNTAARLSWTGRWSVGDFYDGDKQQYQLGTTVRMSEHVTTTLNVSRNQIQLGTGAYTTHLITGRLDYSLSTRTFLNALLQYNTDVQEWSSNIRFNIIHRPLSDFFLVYNERRHSETRDIIDRAVVAKMTYMVAF